MACSNNIYAHFTRNHTEICKIFTQKHWTLQKLPFTQYTFHANGEITFVLDSRNLAHDPSQVGNTEWIG